MVLYIIKCIEEESHHVYFDFFSSPSLSLALRQKLTYIIGTTRTNKKGFPKELHDKSFEKTAQRGQRKSVLIRDGQSECLPIMKESYKRPFSSLLKTHQVQAVVERETEVTVPTPPVVLRSSLSAL